MSNREVIEWLRKKAETTPSALGTNLAEVGTDVPDNNVGELMSKGK